VRVFSLLSRTSLAVCAIAFLCPLGQTLSTQAVPPSKTAAPSENQTEDNEVKAGPFAIGGENYTVVFLKKRLSIASDPARAETLASLEIRNAAGAVFYHKDFSYALDQDHFQRNVSASAQLLSGKTGAGLLIRYLDRDAAPPAGAPQASESWQLFPLVNGKLARLGKPAVIGEPSAGAALTGVMIRAPNGTVSVINPPDLIDLRAWAGSFYVLVPLRVDWGHGSLGEGQRCIEMFAGRLENTGCEMRIEAARKQITEEYAFVRLLAEARENPENAEHVVLQKNSRVELLGASAITRWEEKGELIQPAFSDVWLHVRIDDRTGWIHGEDDFAAIGLPAGSPDQ
jgi:hypothetical protein